MYNDTYEPETSELVNRDLAQLQQETLQLESEPFQPQQTPASGAGAIFTFITLSFIVYAWFVNTEFKPIANAREKKRLQSQKGIL